jgi:hypothetical protein
MRNRRIIAQANGFLSEMKGGPYFAVKLFFGAFAKTFEKHAGTEHTSHALRTPNADGD